MIKGIIFDFDGVIVDSEPLYIETLLGYLAGLGVKTSEEKISYVIGQNLNDIGSDIISQFGLNMTVEEFVNDSRAYYFQRNKNADYPLLPGAKEFIERCHQKGLAICVASSSGYEYLHKILESKKLLPYFRFILSGEDFVHSKPDPEIYNKAAELLGIEKEGLMIIEDSLHGVMAGKASGIFTVAYKGAKFKQDTPMADLEICDFKELNI